MSTNIEVRFATKNDYSAIKGAERKIIEILKRKGIREWYLGNIAQSLERNNGQCILATRNKEILGVICLDDANEKKIQELFPKYNMKTGLRVASIIVLPSKFRREVSHSLIEYARGYAEENDKNCFFGAVHPDDRVVNLSLALHLKNIEITDETFPVMLGDEKISQCRYFLGGI